MKVRSGEANCYKLLYSVYLLTYFTYLLLSSPPSVQFTLTANVMRTLLKTYSMF